VSKMDEYLKMSQLPIGIHKDLRARIQQHFAAAADPVDPDAHARFLAFIAGPAELADNLDDDQVQRVQRGDYVDPNDEYELPKPYVSSRLKDTGASASALGGNKSKNSRKSSRKSGRKSGRKSSRKSGRKSTRKSSRKRY